MVKNMIKSISLFFSLLGFSAVCACGGDTGGPDDAATASDVQAACDAICSEDDRCDPDGPDENCRADCREENASYAGNVRADILDGLRACFAGLTCEEHEDSCAERALESVGLSLENVIKDADVQTCLAKQHECAGTTDSFSDDMCLLLPEVLHRDRCLHGARVRGLGRVPIFCS
jgi:hypothetical protein